MSTVKKILRNRIVIRVLSTVAATVMRFIYYTNRWERVNWKVPEAFAKTGDPAVGCFWHNRLLMMPFAWEQDPSNFYMLISAHRDGLLIAETIRRFGLQTVAGSSSKGGDVAMRHMLDALKRGGAVGITPDGPRGPRFRARYGAVNLAHAAGVSVVPVSYSTTRRKVLSSWDRFILPLPFGRGVMICGDPIEIPKDLARDALEPYRVRLENALQEISIEADRLCGHAPLLAEDA